MKNWVVLCILFLLPVSAVALPDYSTDIWYYDSAGNLIGSYSITCNGHRFTTGVTSEIYEQFSMPCSNLQPLMCSDSGLYSLAGSSCGSCYSGSYNFWYEWDELPDCAGRYVCRNHNEWDPNPGNGNPSECCVPGDPGCCDPATNPACRF